VDPRHAVLFEPIDIGPKTLPNRFYQVPHASGFGVERPRTHAAFRGIKAEGGWGGVCVDYTSFSLESEESPDVSALFWDDADAKALGLSADAIHAHGGLAGIELFHGGAHSENGQSRAIRVAPSQHRSQLIWGGLPKQMDAGDIARIQREWVAAARRAGVWASTSSTFTARTDTCCQGSSPPISTSAPMRTADRWRTADASGSRHWKPSATLSVPTAPSPRASLSTEGRAHQASRLTTCSS
jgi:hypothetical protein